MFPKSVQNRSQRLPKSIKNQFSFEKPRKSKISKPSHTFRHFLILQPFQKSSENVSENGLECSFDLELLKKVYFFNFSTFKTEICPKILPKMEPKNHKNRATQSIYLKLMLN